MNAYQPEQLLVDKLVTALEADFEIILEDRLRSTTGVFRIDGMEHKCYPDMIITPKSHLSDYFEQDCSKWFIPVEVKHISTGDLESDVDKYERMLYQVHSYRLSSFDNRHPRIALYFVGDAFDTLSRKDLAWDHNRSRDYQSPDYWRKHYIHQKRHAMTLFGRLGVGEILLQDGGYTFTVVRQLFFGKVRDNYKSNLNLVKYWWGSNASS
ncbi:MAG: hypothetical protein EOO16_00310 [Chitinophagaceae bacterium]|nr:MAG: hypothetical protein EOO16_00310 [Chitinophagaceae bacterium]